MAHMHTSMKKVHQYAHHTYQHLDGLMKEVMLPQDIEKLGFQRPQQPAIRPPDNSGAAQLLLWLWILILQTNK